MENTQVGPFLILKRLGTNRRQKVFRARQVEQGREVALKFITVPPSIEWHLALDKLDREFNQLQKLRHPNLVKVYGAGVEDEKIFLATELIKGEALSGILRRRGKLAPDQVVEYGRQIAEFLKFLHSKDLIHSKLTPEKILITPDHQVKISDLRLNRSKRRRWDSTRQRELDIAAYMAPETFTEGATEKSDFYSLGVILYEMLSGQLPYPPDTMGRMTQNKMNAPVPSVATHVMNCPIWLDKIVSQMLNPNPRRRPHSAQAIALAFEEIKNMDATRKAAVSQMTSGFNALTAGQDKSEAKRLLGQKKERSKESSEPIYQKIWFQVAALLGICLLMFIMLRPESRQSIFNRAKALVESDDFDSWADARGELEPLIKNKGSYTDEAQELYFVSRQKTLVARAEAGKSSRLDNKYFQLFSKAVRFQQEGRDEDAADIFARLAADIDPHGDERHINRESKKRYASLTAKFEWPETTDGLLAMINETESATTEDELVVAQSTLGKMAIELAGKPEFANVRQHAETQLKKTKQKLIDLRTQNPPPSSGAPD